jgi:hypothetical protein
VKIFNTEAFNGLKEVAPLSCCVYEVTDTDGNRSILCASIYESKEELEEFLKEAFKIEVVNQSRIKLIPLLKPSDDIATYLYNSNDKKSYEDLTIVDILNDHYIDEIPAIVKLAKKTCNRIKLKSYATFGNYDNNYFIELFTIGNYSIILNGLYSLDLALLTKDGVTVLTKALPMYLGGFPDIHKELADGITLSNMLDEIEVDPEADFKFINMENNTLKIDNIKEPFEVFIAHYDITDGIVSIELNENCGENHKLVIRCVTGDSNCNDCINHYFTIENPKLEKYFKYLIGTYVTMTITNYDRIAEFNRILNLLILDKETKIGRG